MWDNSKITFGKLHNATVKLKDWKPYSPTDNDCLRGYYGFVLLGYKPTCGQL